MTFPARALLLLTLCGIYIFLPTKSRVKQYLYFQSFINKILPVQKRSVLGVLPQHMLIFCNCPTTHLYSHNGGSAYLKQLGFMALYLFRTV